MATKEEKQQKAINDYLFINCLEDAIALKSKRIKEDQEKLRLLKQESDKRTAELKKFVKVNKINIFKAN